jgi:phage gp29-like protein
VWDRRDDHVVPVWFAEVPHRRIRFNVETDEPRLLTKGNTTDGEALEPGRWLFARRRHRKTVRAGLMRTAIWWSWIKGLSVRDWQLFCSRFGIPFVLGTHSVNAVEATIQTLEDAIKAFGSNGGAVLPEGTQLEVKEIAVGGNNANVHPGLVALANAELSKLIAGGTLTSGEGSSTGSYALGTVHQQNKFALALGDATKLGNWVSTQLGAAFIRFNGLAARPPRLMHRVVPDLNPLERMKLLSIYCNELGGELDDDQVREENGIKRPTGKALKGTKAGPAEGAPGEEKPAEDDPPAETP